MEDGFEPLTYRGLVEEAGRLAQGLRERGVDSTDVVALATAPDARGAAATVAVLCSFTAFPLNAELTDEELAASMERAPARALLYDTRVGSRAAAVAARLGIQAFALTQNASLERGLLLDAAAKRAREATIGHEVPSVRALLVETSGTTGRPKRMAHTHATLAAATAITAKTLRLAADDRCLGVLPLFHTHALVGALLTSLATGGSVVFADAANRTAVAETIRRHRPTWLTATPPIHHLLLGSIDLVPPEERRFRFVRTGSAPLPIRLHSELERAYDAPVLEVYALSEAPGQVTCNPLPPAERKPGSAGRAYGCEVAVLADGRLVRPGIVGEVLVRGPHVIDRYLDGEAEAEAHFFRGWLRSGDLGYLDEDGYLVITGRIKEVINRGGEKVSPGEIEEVLMAHPAVVDAAVFPLPHPTLGEEVASAVVTSGTLDAQELRAHAAVRLAPFKVPRQIVFVDAIPRTPTGKVPRLALATELGLARASESRPSPRR